MGLILHFEGYSGATVTGAAMHEVAAVSVPSKAVCRKIGPALKNGLNRFCENE